MIKAISDDSSFLYPEDVYFNIAADMVMICLLVLFLRVGALCAHNVYLRVDSLQCVLCAFNLLRHNDSMLCWWEFHFDVFLCHHVKNEI